MKVLYVCFTDFDDINRGSAVRPYKIYNTFIDHGYDVVLINGDVNKRRSTFLKHKKDEKFNDIDYCYIEPSTYPCHPYDYLMFNYIKSLRVPVGLFYRDMYYKFPEFFNKKGLRKIQLLFRYKIDWIMFKRISKTIFFPSNRMADYFNFDSKVALPPAGEIKIKKENKLHHNVIYVGGVSRMYGTDMLLEAMKIVNQTFGHINLILVCREYDGTFFNKYKNEDWLIIKHASGDELEKLYELSDAALIPNKKNEYHDFAVPTKLFEYLSYNMPIITTNLFETAKFVSLNKVGIVSTDEANEFANSVIEMYNDNNAREQYIVNTRKTILNDNLWFHRIKKIENCLLSEIEVDKS